MLMAQITGSDYFGPVHETETTDNGKTWTEPRPVPGLGRRPAVDGIEEGSCDFVPEYHAPTKTVLAMGHNVFYRGGKFFRDQPPRQAVYSVRDKAGQWSDLRRFPWDDPRGGYIYTSNCAQRVTLPDGDVIVPLSFGHDKKGARSVATVRCSFNGKDLAVKALGPALSNPVGRGLLEPSIAHVGGRFFLTLRAEDERGYVSASDDGLTWAPQVAWAWDDGESLAMSTTQQRWLVHSEQLYLVYTRRTEENKKVMRWRSPLFVSLVDRKRLCLVRATERVVLPLVGDPVNDPAGVAHLGNFHVEPISPEESWVTVGEVMPKNYRGDVLLARIRWARPN
ncbi:MAG: sialidase family protein [Kiritimatiellae bacterium]|nr:sialidase family protein [Kiritimatiellia bacterium]MDD5522940.1 sialidase family protein [Kiritimatiellia bacterium]